MFVWEEDKCETELTDLNFIQCPFCNRFLKDSWDYGLDDEFQVMECPYCEKDFEARIQTEYYYVSRKLEENRG